MQAIVVAFFGALLEALAGFGTPVAITVVMLMALGFEPMKAAVVALVANTAPVALRRAGHAHRHALRHRHHRCLPTTPRLNTETLGAMVGRQTPLLAVVVPLILVFIVDGRRGLRNAWLPAIHRCGVAFAVAPVRRRQLHLGPPHRHRRLAGRRRSGGAAAALLVAARGADRRAGRGPVVHHPRERPSGRGTSGSAGGGDDLTDPSAPATPVPTSPAPTRPTW